MTRSLLIVGAFLVTGVFAGCTSSPEAPCESDEDPSVQVVPAGLGFDEWMAGDALVAATPPQGGAPYTPLRARVTGLVDPQIGVTLSLSGVDPSDGSEYGEITYDTRLICANVGESAGLWLAADVHYRYFDWELDELDGRQAEISFSVEDLHGNVVESTIGGSLGAQ